MITNIQAVNFLSWKQLDFTVPDGVTLIDGWNEDDGTSEGSGKSAILNALSWAIYGKIPKDAKIDDVIKLGEKDCAVVVTFADGSRILRQRKPNDLKILDADGSEIKGKDAKETQKLVEDRFGFSFDVFCQTIYFAQNYDKKFITANQEEKGKILSEVQDLSSFDKARKETMALIKREEYDVEQQKNKIQLLRKDQEVLNVKISSHRNLYEQKVQAKTNTLERLKADIIKCSEDIERNAAWIEVQRKNLTGVDEERYAKLQAELQELNNKAAVNNEKLVNINAESKRRVDLMQQGQKYGARCKALDAKIQKLVEFKQNPNKSCPTCGTVLGEHDTSHVDVEIQELETEKKEIYGMLNDVASQLATPAQNEDALNEVAVEINTKVKDVNQKLQHIDAARRKVENFERDKLSVEQSNKDLENKAHTLHKEYQELEAKPIIMETSEEALNAEFNHIETQIGEIHTILETKNQHLIRLNALKSGFKEVKLHVFNSLLNEINARAAQYINKLFDVPVTLRFVNDNMKINTDITLNGESRGLGLLSGGQFRRVSLATDLALSDVISARRGKSQGILILDEYFKDLSEQSMEKCLDLLKARQQSVVLIEHNSIFKSIVDNTFFVNLKQGTSYAEETGT